MDFANVTDLDSRRLERLFLRHTVPYRHDRLAVRVRYTRRAEFSGTCFYQTSRIFVNIGRRVVYPYRLVTHVAKSRCNATHWWREAYRLVVADAYQLALFIYLHELFHFLVKAARRNTRRKEAMCDRFAVGVLVDQYGCLLLDSRDNAPARASWDFQDLRGFVAAAPQQPRVVTTDVDPSALPELPLFEHGALQAARKPRPIPVRVLGAAADERTPGVPASCGDRRTPRSRLLPAGD